MLSGIVPNYFSRLIQLIFELKIHSLFTRSELTEIRKRVSFRNVIFFESDTNFY